MSDQPNSNLLNPYCAKCKGSGPKINVITHECLEGDALRCVIKAVPDDVPLNPDDYVRVSDLLQYLQGSLDAPSESATSAIASSTASSTAIAIASSSDASSIVVTPTPSPSMDVQMNSTAPSVFTLTTTADEGSLTTTMTTTLGVATSFASTTVSSTSSAVIPIITTVVGPSVNCTTLYPTSVLTLSATPAPFTNSTVMVGPPYQSAPSFPAFSQRPNSRTASRPGGGWPFEQTKTLTSSGSPTVTPPGSPSRNNRIVYPGGRPANRDRVKDMPLSRVLKGDILERRGDGHHDGEFTDSSNDVAFPKPSSIAAIASQLHSADHSLPKLTARDQNPFDYVWDPPRRNIEIDADIARIILGRDETLNPNSALLQKLRPRLAVSRREDAPPMRAEAERTYFTTEEQMGLDANATLAANQKEFWKYHGFALTGPLERATFGLLVALSIGAILSLMVLCVKRRSGHSFEKV